MPILYMLKVSVYAGFMQIFSGTYCGLSLKNYVFLKFYSYLFVIQINRSYLYGKIKQKREAFSRTKTTPQE